MFGICSKSKSVHPTTSTVPFKTMCIRRRHIHTVIFSDPSLFYSDCDVSVSSSFMTELAISTPEGRHEGSPEEDLMPIPSLNVQESSEQVSIQPGTQVAVYIMRFQISFFFEP